VHCGGTGKICAIFSILRIWAKVNSTQKTTPPDKGGEIAVIAAKKFHVSIF